ncbi:MAG: xanthine dehydrogenase family protein molybdopterin-binding subunit [Nitrososphaerales archaeon]
MQEIQQIYRKTEPLERVDGAQRAGGRALFTDDIKISGLLYGRIIPSMVAHGRVKKIDISEAAKVEGVATILTCENTLVRWPSGDRINERLVFAPTPRFFGDCIGAVAGVSREVCEKAVSLVTADYDILPTSFDPMQSLSDESTKIWPSGNMQKEYSFEFGDIQKSLSESKIVFENTYKTNRHHCAALEPAVSLAFWDEGKLTVHASTQGISRCRHELSLALGIDESRIRVICKFKGGGFGNKNNAMDYDIIAALLSREARRPVLLEYTRSEDFTNLHGRWATSQRVKLGLAKNGNTLAYDVDAICDIGAYGRHPAGKYVGGPENLYSLKSMKVKAIPVYTNTPTTGNMRAPVGVPSTFAFETAVDEAAYSLGRDPLEFRLSNLTNLSEGSIPFSSNGLQECIKHGAEMIDWQNRFQLHTSGDRDASSAVGIGVALAAWHSEIETSAVKLKVEADGSVSVSAGIVDIGTGAKTALALIAATELGLNRSQINIETGDTETCPPFIGESGSKTTATMNMVVKQAALKLKDMILDRAASRLHLRKDSLRLDADVVRSRETDGKHLSLKELASSSEPAIVVTEMVEAKIPPNVARSSFGAHFCEVNVDFGLGKITVERYVAVHDSGHIVNRLTAESQVQGGVVMGIGLALMEELVFDHETGTLLNPSLNSYHIPRNDDIPPIEVDFVETNDPYGPKSLGEVPVMPVSPCIGNAVFNATGIRFREIPITPERFIRAMI